MLHVEYIDMDMHLGWPAGYHFCRWSNEISGRHYSSISKLSMPCFMLKYTAFTYLPTGKKLFQTDSLINFGFHREWSAAQCLLFKSWLSILNQISHSEDKHKQTAQLSDVMKGVMNDEAHLFILYNIMN